jgi:hypothetical protein
VFNPSMRPRARRCSSISGVQLRGQLPGGKPVPAGTQGAVAAV